MPPRQGKLSAPCCLFAVCRGTDLRIATMDLATRHQAILILLVLLFSILLSLVLLFASEVGRLKAPSQPLLRRRDR